MAYTDDERQIMREGEALSGLINHPAWKIYVDLLGRASSIHLTQLVEGDLKMRPLVEKKGLIKGLQLALNLPEATIAQMKALRAREPSED